MAVNVPQDVTTHLMNHLSLHPTLRTCSSDTILIAIKELTQENISYTSDMGKTYDFNAADTLNTLLLNCIFASGQLKDDEMYDVDFDHQFIETAFVVAFMPDLNKGQYRSVSVMLQCPLTAIQYSAHISIMQ